MSVIDHEPLTNAGSWFAQPVTGPIALDGGVADQFVTFVALERTSRSGVVHGARFLRTAVSGAGAAHVAASVLRRYTLVFLVEERIHRHVLSALNFPVVWRRNFGTPWRLLCIVSNHFPYNPAPFLMGKKSNEK
jgi:hypothetical protein